MSMSESWPEAQATVPASVGSDKLVQLTLKAVAPYTEIRLLDARFVPVALSANTGQVEVGVSPGLYEVGFRTADGWQSQHVIVSPELSDLHVDQEVSHLPAPDMISPPQSFIDDEATVVVDLTPSIGTAGSADGSPALDGSISVTLINADDPSSLAQDLRRESAGLWRFVAAPGYWRLRINEPHPRQPFEVAITVVSNYVAYVTAPVRHTDGGACFDLDRFRFRLLQTGSTMAPTGDLIGFEETALAALGANRSLFGPALEQLIDNLVDDKALNPMLGILAAHLCHQNRDETLDFQDRLLRWLESVTGTQPRHPDVYALQIGFLMRTGGTLQGLPPVLFPPLLAASWRILVEASRQEPALIPIGSLGDRIADRLWASAQWVAWTAPPVEAGGAQAVPTIDEPGPQLRTITTAPRPRKASPPKKTKGKRQNAAGGATINIATSFESIVEASTPAGFSMPETPAELGDMVRSPAANTAMIESGLSHSELRDWVRVASGEASKSSVGVEWLSEHGITPAEVAIASAVFPIAPNEKLQSTLMEFAESLQKSRIAGQLPTALDRTEALDLPRATIERALDSFANKLVGHAARFNIKL